MENKYLLPLVDNTYKGTSVISLYIDTHIFQLIRCITNIHAHDKNIFGNITVCGRFSSAARDRQFNEELQSLHNVTYGR